MAPSCCDYFQNSTCTHEASPSSNNPNPTACSSGNVPTTLRRPTSRIVIWSQLSALAQWSASVAVSLGVIFGLPLSFYCIEPDSSSNLALSLRQVGIGWTALLHVSAWLLMVITAFVAFFLAQEAHHKALRNAYCSNAYCAANSASSSSDHPKWLTKKAFFLCGHCNKSPSAAQSSLILSIVFTLAVLVQSNLQMIYPSWAWNPFLWGGYHVYKPATMAQALEGLCLDSALAAATAMPFSQEITNRTLDSSRIGTKSSHRLRSAASSLSSQPKSEQLCLTESKWKELSTEGLSSKVSDDIDVVLKGIQYTKNKSGGIIISIMSRDTIDAIPILRQNVEGLLPFLSNLSVVVFENDSQDGSREAFYQWSSEVSGKYIVDVMECEDAPGCKFNIDHRDFSQDQAWEKSSAIGRMAEFRQRMVDYILTDSKYKTFTHMIVLDLDLGVSLSPLGVIHTLGLFPDHPVASAGRQVWPGSFGTIAPWYDFSALRFKETTRNKRLIRLHRRFCDLKSKGDRWRNMCDAVSPMHTMLVLGADMLGKEPYLVESAFNGATIYPLNLIRESNAQYDAGDDGQRCEHIGFNLSLQKPFYVNPQWAMHLSPNSPGGPTGDRASKTIVTIARSPVIGPLIFLINAFSMILFVYCVMTLVMKLVYPFWVKMVTGGSCQVGRRKRRGDPNSSDFEFLLKTDIDAFSSKRKRKVSDFEFITS